MKALITMLMTFALFFVQISPNYKVQKNQNSIFDLPLTVKLSSDSEASGDSTTVYDGGEVTNPSTGMPIARDVFIVILVAFLATTFLMGKCFTDIGMMAFAAGALIYIIQEVILNKNFADAIERSLNIDRPDGSTDGMDQYNTFIDAAETQRKAAITARSKASNVQTFITMTYIAIALVIAQPLIMCIGPDYFVCVGKFNGCNGLRGSIDNFERFRNIASINDYQSTELDSLINLERYDQSIMSQETLAFNNPYNNCEANENSIKANNIKSEIKSALAQYSKSTGELFDLIIPQAHAFSLEMLLGAAAGIITPLLLMKKAFFTTIRNVPWYLKLAGLAVILGLLYWAKGNWNNIAEEYESNANKYEGIANRIMTSLNTNAATNTTRGNITMNSTAGVGFNNGGFSGSQSNQQSPCAVGAPGELTIDPNCQCQANNSCKKPEFPKVDFASLNLPSFAGQAYGQLQTGGSALYSGDTAGASTAFGNANRFASKLGRLKDIMFKKGVEEAKKATGGKFDMEDAKKQTMKAMVKGVQGGLNSMNPQQLQGLQGLGLLGSGTGTKSGVNNDKLSKAAKNLEQQGVKVDLPKPVDGKKGGGSMFDFKFDDDSKKTAGKGDDAKSAKDALSEFESNENDIVDNPGVSIWTVITTRYFKSAFPKIFDEKKKGGSLDQ